MATTCQRQERQLQLEINLGWAAAQVLVSLGLQISARVENWAKRTG